MNHDALSYVQSGHIEASRLRRIQLGFKAGLTALSLFLASAVGVLVHQHSVNEQNRAVLKRVRDLQEEVERQILSIEETLAEGGSLERREPEMFGVSSFSQTQKVLTTSRKIQDELEDALGKK